MTARVVAASGLAAAALWAVGLTACAPLLHGGTGHAHAGPGLAAAGGMVAWALMATAMMLPAAAPLIGAVECRRALLAAGYLTVWVAAGMVALAAATLAGPAALPAALAAAGAYQLTAQKRRALRRCLGQRRLAEAGTGDPSGDAVRAGVAHGVATLRCCGPMMALMALGLAGPAWMLLLGGVMAAEAATSAGERIRVPLGILLLGAALWVLWAGRPPGA
jgi:predicted metal-binding membrane protein